MDRETAERALAATRHHLDAGGSGAAFVAVALEGQDALRAPITTTALRAAAPFAEHLRTARPASQVAIVGRQAEGRRITWSVWDRRAEQRVLVRLEELEETIHERREGLV